jgi:tetraacyldisaccharide 4'-kinase
MLPPFEQFMRKQWERVGWWHLVLIPLSWLFATLSILRRLAYQARLLKSAKLPVPVIVVGNISVGGTGKTPLVAWLAGRLQQHGYSPAIISRGYGGNGTSISPVFADSDPFRVGDEPLLLARHGSCPVWVGRERHAVGLALLQSLPECNVIISDDGLQHYKLQRDVEVVVVDAEYGFGNGLLLPAGPLREGKGRLKTVDAVISNGGGAFSGTYSMHLAGDTFRSVADPAMTATSLDFSGRRLAAIAGIGRPDRFFAKLSQMGLQCHEFAFPDHYAFQLQDLQSIQADVILMTEKDAVKCAAFAQKNWWYLPVRAEVDEALAVFVLNKLRNLNGP